MAAFLLSGPAYNLDISAVFHEDDRDDGRSTEAASPPIVVIPPGRPGHLLRAVNLRVWSVELISGGFGRPFFYLRLLCCIRPLRITTARCTRWIICSGRLANAAGARRVAWLSSSTRQLVTATIATRMKKSSRGLPAMLWRTDERSARFVLSAMPPHWACLASSTNCLRSQPAALAFSIEIIIATKCRQAGLTTISSSACAARSRAITTSAFMSKAPISVRIPFGHDGKFHSVCCAKELLGTSDPERKVPAFRRAFFLSSIVVVPSAAPSAIVAVAAPMMEIVAAPPVIVAPEAAV